MSIVKFFDRLNAYDSVAPISFGGQFSAKFEKQFFFFDITSNTLCNCIGDSKYLVF